MHWALISPSCEGVGRTWKISSGEIRDDQVFPLLLGMLWDPQENHQEILWWGHPKDLLPLALPSQKHREGLKSKRISASSHEPWGKLKHRCRVSHRKTDDSLRQIEGRCPKQAPYLNTIRWSWGPYGHWYLKGATIPCSEDNLWSLFEEISWSLVHRLKRWNYKKEKRSWGYREAAAKVKWAGIREGCSKLCQVGIYWHS